MNNTSDYYGDGGRLSSTPKDTLIQTAYTHDCNDADILLPGLHKADLAYALMLIEEKIIPRDIGINLLKGLRKLENIPVDEFPIDPANGDVYNSKDLALKKEISDAAGWLHIGRARREAVNIAYLISVRERLLVLGESIISLAQQILKVAERERHTIMPDFTYMHHAHPTTVGHYLLTFVYPMLRDIDRLRSVFSKINMSPAGSDSVNGSALPLNRDRLCELLDFDDVITHTRDAMWQTDTPLEVMSMMTMTLMNINRIADEFQVWNTSEFNMIELPDELCRASVIMPQKKNPYPLAYVRGVTASLLGHLSSFASYGRSITGNPDSRIFIYGELPRSLDKGTGAVNLMNAVFDGLQFNADIMLERVYDDYSYSTDLAEHMVLNYSLDYRTAHQVMGLIVRKMIDNKLPGNMITAELVNQAGEEIAGIKFNISQTLLTQVINPKNIIDSRKTVGGASETRMNEMFSECDNKLNELVNWHKSASIKTQFTRLDTEIDNIIGDK